VVDGWAPWLAIGREGRTVRRVRLDGDALVAEAAAVGIP